MIIALLVKIIYSIVKELKNKEWGRLQFKGQEIEHNQS